MKKWEFISSQPLFYCPGWGRGSAYRPQGSVTPPAMPCIRCLFQIFLPELPCQSQRLLEQEEMESPHGVQKPEGLLDGSQRLPAFCSFFVGVYASCLACSPLARNAPKSASRIILKMPFLLFTIITSIRIIAKGRALGKVW